MDIYRISTWALIASLLPVMGCREKPAAPAAPPPLVLTAPAQSKDVPVFSEWTGSLDGSENAEIRARVVGNLTTRDYQEGSFVKKGDLLFEIDPRPSEAALAQAQEQLEQAKATQVASGAEAERTKQLYSKNVISTEEYTNKLQLNEAKLAEVRALEAAVDQAKLNVQYCRVTSPVDGIAGIAQAQIGDLVGTGSNMVLTSVSTLDPVKVVFPVSESEYLGAAERLSQSLAKPISERPEVIELILADGNTFPSKGRLLSVDRQVNTATGTILVTALVKNPGNILRPGFFARARVTTSVLKNAVVIPQRAVSEIQGSYQIALVGADGKAEIRPVKVGPQTGTDWVIASGLKPGENVIVEGGQKVRSGAPVTAKPWVPPVESSAGEAAE